MLLRQIEIENRKTRAQPASARLGRPDCTVIFLGASLWLYQHQDIGG